METYAAHRREATVPDAPPAVLRMDAQEAGDQQTAVDENATQHGRSRVSDEGRDHPGHAMLADGPPPGDARPADVPPPRHEILEDVSLPRGSALSNTVRNPPVVGRLDDSQEHPAEQRVEAAPPQSSSLSDTEGVPAEQSDSALPLTGRHLAAPGSNHVDALYWA